MKRSLLSTFWVLLLLIITVTLLPQTHAKAAEADAETFYYHHLNERQQYFYTWLKDYYDKLPSEPATYQVDLTHLLPAAPHPAGLPFPAGRYSLCRNGAGGG